MSTMSSHHPLHVLLSEHIGTVCAAIFPCFSRNIHTTSVTHHVTTSATLPSLRQDHSKGFCNHLMSNSIASTGILCSRDPSASMSPDPHSMYLGLKYL